MSSPTLMYRLLQRISPAFSSTTGVNGSMPNSDLVRGILVIFSSPMLVVLGAVLGVLISIIHLSTATPLYTARMVIGPAQTNTGLGGQASGLRQQLNFLVGDTGGSTVDPYSLFNELITSSALAERLQQRHHVLQVLYAGNWDSSRYDWRPPSGIVAFLSGSLKALFGRPSWIPPNVVDLQEVLKGGLTSLSDGGSQYFKVYTYKNKDPNVAVWFLKLVYQEADAEARAITLKRATELSSYIKSRISTDASPDYRATLYQALAQQDLLVVMSTSNAPFAAQIIDPPRSSPAPTDPAILSTIILGLALGAVLGAIAGYGLAWSRTLTQKINGSPAPRIN